MKKITYLIVVCLFIANLCRAQQYVDVHEKDALVYQFINAKDIQCSNCAENRTNKEIYSKDSILIISQRWVGYGSLYFDKKYSLVKGADTMNIKCNCRQEQNIYFKNFKFKKGNYELKYDYGKNYNGQTGGFFKVIIYGYQIKTPEEIQNILFKNTFVDADWETKDVYFKDLKFWEIDLKDTANVKLTKLDKIE